MVEFLSTLAADKVTPTWRGRLSRVRLLFTHNMSAFIEYKISQLHSTQIETNQDRDMGQQIVGRRCAVLLPLQSEESF